MVGAVFCAAASLLGLRSAREYPGHPLPGVAAVILAGSPVDDVYHGQLCAGVQVAPTTVLTAAHCVADQTADSINVVLGADNLCRGRPVDGERVAVSAVTVHPDYEPTTGQFDLAALIVRGGAHPTARTIGASVAEGAATAFGWGGGAEGMPTACRLQRTQLWIVAQSRCDELLAGAQHRFDPLSMICALPVDGANTCHGDSGGPLIIGDAEGGPVVGIVSWGRDCESTGAYARAAAWPFPASDRVQGFGP